MAYTNVNNERKVENEKQYIIENDVDEIDQIQFEKPMKTAVMRGGQLPDNYEIEEPTPMTQSIQDDIQKTAQEEGLVSEALGGENPTPEDVISALKTSEMPEGAQKNKEEYEEEKVKKFRKVTATRDLLLNRTKRVIPMHFNAVIDVEDEFGNFKQELVELDFQIKRLSESQVNHIINHKLLNKADSDMTDEEFAQASKFRSKFLAQTVVEPQLTQEEWRNECDAGIMTAAFNTATDILNKIDDTSLFQ